MKDQTPTTATLVLEGVDDNFEAYIEIVDSDTILLDYERIEKITRDELEELLEKRREEIALQTKIEEMADLGYDLLYTDITIYQEKVDVWEEHDIYSDSYGYLQYGDEVYIDDVYVDENGELWLYSYVYNYNTYEYIYFWFRYSDL